jgi:ABC-type uncharacterized transport system substrate-binding protein
MAGPEPVHAALKAFLLGMRALGHVEGQNLIVERRSAEGQYERFGDIVAELVRLKVDVILTVSDRMTGAAHAVTKTVPIVMTVGGDPVLAGLVILARPGGNITGLTFQVVRDRCQAPGVPTRCCRASRAWPSGQQEENNWESPPGKASEPRRGPSA